MRRPSGSQAARKRRGRPASSRRSSCFDGLRAPLRRAVGGAELLAGPALALGDGRRARAARRRAGARRGHGHRPGGGRAARARRLLDRRRRPEPGDAGRGACALRRRPADRRVELLQARGRAAARSPTRASTRSASPTCCATSTIRPRRCASWHASCAPAGRSARSSSASRRSRRRGPRGGCTRTSACRCSGGRSPASGSRWAASWAQHPRLLRAPPAGARSSATGARRASSTSRVRRMSFGAGVVMSARKRRRPDRSRLRRVARPASRQLAAEAGRPAFYARGRGRAGRPRGAAAPAVHAVASQLLRDRRGAAPRRSTSRDCCGASPPSRWRWAWLRTRSTSSTTGRWGPRSATAPCSGCAVLSLARGARDRRRRHPHGLRLADAARDRGRAVPARVQPRARRRALPQRPLVRDRLGRVPGVHRLLRQRRAGRAAGRADRRRLPGDQRRAAPAVRPGAGAAPAHASVTGARERTDGTSEPLSVQSLLDPLDGALMAMSLAMPLIAAALLCARL